MLNEFSQLSEGWLLVFNCVLVDIFFVVEALSAAKALLMVSVEILRAPDVLLD